jgi:hypothetical protein
VGGVDAFQVVCSLEGCKFNWYYTKNQQQIIKSNNNIHFDHSHRDQDGTFRPLDHDEEDDEVVLPDYDPVFQHFMEERITEYWIPFVENLEIANGRRAIWIPKRSVIMFEGDNLLAH